MIMFEKPESVQGGPDVSEFEAEFGGNEFDVLRQEAVDAAQLEALALSHMGEVQRIQADYDNEIAEFKKADSPAKQIGCLRRAYVAALDLKGLGELPTDELLTNLQVRIVATQALINAAPSSQGSDG